MDLFSYEPAESCFRRTVGDWLDLVTSRILKPRIMIVPTHLDKFDPKDDVSVVSRCEDILDRVQHYCKSQRAQIEFEISEKKKKCLRNPVQGTDPEWKKNNPPVISSSLHSSDLPVSYFDLKKRSIGTTVKAPISGHPREAETVSATGAGRLCEV